MRPRHLIGTLTLALLMAAPASAQPGIAVSGRVGTLGIGADASLGIGPFLGLRAGFNVQPWEPSRDFDDIDFTLDLASPSFMGLVDLYPLAGGFRLSGGIVHFGSDHELRGEPTAAVDIGGQSYTPEQIGVLSGRFITKQTAPYAGIGFGRLGGRTGLGFAVDLGVAFHGAPEVDLSASGPIATQPLFLENLEAEERNIEDDAESFSIYPVLSIGFVVGF